MLGEVAIVLALIVLNGVFAMSELAIVSARKARLKSLAEKGGRGARIALALAEEPGRLLSTVQIGITLIGIVAGAYGGASLSGPLAEALAATGLFGAAAEEVAFALVIGVITYLSLIVGELVPKQIALQNPEAVASLMAPPMAALSRLASPLVWVLDASTRLGLRLLGRGGVPDATVSEEEVRALIAEGARTGIFAHAEKEMIDSVLRLGDRGVRALMTPRVDVVWLDADAPRRTVLETLRHHGYSRYPLAEGSIEEVIGVVRTKDLLERLLAGGNLDLRACAVEPAVLPDSVDALRALEVLKDSPVHMALVVDEYGSFEGVVTTGDVLAAVVGELTVDRALHDIDVVRRPDGSWLVDGGLAMDRLRDLLPAAALPADGDYDTAAGFVLDRLRRVPETGDAFDWNGWRFEVVDMDGRRVDKLLITPPAD